MHCANCGSEIAAGSSFCSACGTAVAASTPASTVAQDSPMTYGDYRAYDTYKTALSYEARAEAEYVSLRTSFIRCCILGAFCFAGVMYALATGDFPNYVFTLVVGSVLFGIPAFCAPFGVLLAFNIARDNGAVVWLTVLFFILLFFIVLCFALFAGIPYFIYLIYKMRKAKKEMVEAQELLERARVAAGV